MTNKIFRSTAWIALIAALALTGCAKKSPRHLRLLPHSRRPRPRSADQTAPTPEETAPTSQ